MTNPMTKTMKAAQVMAKGEKYTINNVPIPAPGPGEVLIKLKAAGFCHTDVLSSHAIYGAPFPLTGSHEPAGIIEAVGEGVTTWKKGDHVVALNKVMECGTCYDCKHLDPAFCPNGHLAGLHSNGCFSEYFCAKAKYTARIPDSMSWEDAAPMTCAGVTIFNAIKKAGLKPGGVLAISGLGALGHIGVQIAKAQGLFVVGIDARPGPIDLCASFQLAPDVLIDASKLTAEQAVAAIDAAVKAAFPDERPSGVDAVIATAEVKPAIKYALDITKRHGTFVLLSQPPELCIPFYDLVFKNIAVLGSLQGNGHGLQETMDFVAAHNIVIKTTTWPLEQVNEMWKAQESPSQAGKNVVLF